MTYFLVGTQADDESKRQVTPEMAAAFQKEHNIDYFIEVSSKTGQNVDKLFTDAARCCKY